LAVIALSERRPPEIDTQAFVDETNRSSILHGPAWREARIVHDGRLFVVDDTSQSVGAFKLRGATVAVREDAPDASHITVASSGSFGMSVATAARELGIPTTVYMPADTPLAKRRAIEVLGARVDARFATYEDAKSAARDAARTFPDGRFIDGVGWSVFRGNASLAREIAASGLLAASGAAIALPLGIGSLAVPVALYLAGSGYDTDLVVVEPHTHCKFTSALRNEEPPSPEPTLADGAAVLEVPELSRAILERVTRAAAAVSEQEIAAGIRYLWQTHRIRSEGAGALGVAAYLTAPDLFADYEQVWTIVTGSNIDDRRFRGIVD
jgi:threonine dehydratase